MLANHTGIATLFKRIVLQYDRLRKRNAYLENYKKFEMFRDGFEEFDTSREIVTDLINEYEAAERSDYLSADTEDNPPNDGLDTRTDGITGR